MKKFLSLFMYDLKFMAIHYADLSRVREEASELVWKGYYNSKYNSIFLTVTIKRWMKYTNLFVQMPNLFNLLALITSVLFYKLSGRNYYKFVETLFGLSWFPLAFRILLLKRSNLFRNEFRLINKVHNNECPS